MDLDRLRLFLQVVELGSMSAASKAAHLTQPAISRSLHQLEEQLGVPLFEKQGRGLGLTAAGRALVARARELLDLSTRAARDVSRAAERAYCDLRFGAIDSVATFLVPDIIAPLVSAFPGLALKLCTARTSALLERIEQGSLDLAVVAYAGPPPESKATAIAPYRLQYYGRRDLFPELARVSSTRELRSLPLVELEPPPGTGARVPDDSLSYAIASNVATVKALVLAGLGVGNLPDFMIRPSERALLTRREIEHDPTCSLFVVRSENWCGDAEDRIAATIVGELKKLIATSERGRSPTKSRRRART